MKNKLHKQLSPRIVIYKGFEKILIDNSNTQDNNYIDDFENIGKFKLKKTRKKNLDYI